MRKIYHICLSSHDEVLFRCERDYVIGFNCLAEAAFYTGSKLLADGFMSTHWHTIVQTDFDARQLLLNEQGCVNRSMMTDLELCRLIDSFYLPWLKGKDEGVSVYTCSLQEKTELFDIIRFDLNRYRNAPTQDRRTLLGRAELCGKTATDNQLMRCLVLR